MTRVYIILFILSLLLACKAPVLEETSVCTGNFIGDQVSKTDTFNTIIQRYIDRGVPGISVLIDSDEGTYVHAAGMADIVGDQALLPCHIGKVGSITKFFMGVLSNRLVEEGAVSLDDPITKWLATDITSRLENADCATLGSLLNHTACIYDLVSDQSYTLDILNNPNTTRSADDLLRFAYGKKAPCACGEKPAYSNTHTLLVSLILEAATGKSHAQLLDEYIITPINLTNTYYYDHSIPLRESTTHGYLDIANQGRGLTDVTDWNTGSGHGYTGIYSNVFDLQIFMNAVFKENSLFSEDTRNRMFSDFKITDDGSWEACYGAGKNFLEKGESNFSYGHGGADLGYSAGAYFFPNQNVTLCFTINYGRNLQTDLGDEVSDFIEAISDAAIGR